MTRTVTIGNVTVTLKVLPPAGYDPSHTGGTVEMTDGEETRRLYLDLGRLPLDQEDLDTRDADLLGEWWQRGEP